MAIKKNRLAFLLVALAAIIVFAACGSSASEPTATPAPTATATPEPVLAITIDPQEDPAGFLAALPQSEVDCATSAVGGTDTLTELVSLSGEAPADVSDTQLKVLASCISNDTVQKVVLGQLELETGGLSPSTSSCITNYTDGIDFASLFSGQTVEQDTIVSTLQALFCLSPEERQALESSDQDLVQIADLGGIDALECAVDGAGPDGIEQFGNIFDPDGGVDTAAVGAFMPLLIECGVVDDDVLAATGISSDQFSCLFDQLDPEVLSSLLSISDDPSASPDLSSAAELLSVLADCGIDLQAIIDSDGSEGSDPLPGGGTLISSELLLCLTENGVSPTNAASYAAGLIAASDPAVATALAICESGGGSSGSGGGLVIPDSGGGSTTIDPSVFETLPITVEQAQCLIDEVGVDQLEGIADGTVSPLTVLSALGACNISIADLIAS